MIDDANIPTWLSERQIKNIKILNKQEDRIWDKYVKKTG